jgi:hypothetical protein
MGGCFSSEADGRPISSSGNTADAQHRRPHQQQQAAPLNHQACTQSNSGAPAGAGGDWRPRCREQLPLALPDAGLTMDTLLKVRITCRCVHVIAFPPPQRLAGLRVERRGSPHRGGRATTPAAAHQQYLSSHQHTPRHSTVPPPTPTPPRTSPRHPKPARRQVQEFQSSLSAVSDTPGLGLSEAADMLLGQLDASHVSIFGFCGGAADKCQPPLQEQPPAAVLLAACGRGVRVLERNPVVTEPTWSCLRMQAGQKDRLAACASAHHQQQLPTDWLLLHREYGLQSFIVVPIGPAGSPWGALMVASKADGDLDDPQRRLWQSAAAVSLVHLMRHWQTAAVCRLLREAVSLDDRVAMISHLIQGARSFMDRAANLKTAARLGLIDGTSTRALVFELGAGQQAAGDLIEPSCVPAAGNGASLPRVAALRAAFNPLLWVVVT